MKVESLRSPGDPDWLELRLALWPGCGAGTHRREMEGFVAEPARYAQFMVRSDAGRGIGLAEASVRSEHVPGTSSSPAAFLEGLYVRPEFRRQGVARALVNAVALWARARGCAELASDTGLENILGQTVHAALGFSVTERVVYFNRRLGAGEAD